MKREILESGPVPQHVAVIMDGNGRWAKKRGRLRVFGHLAGRKSVRRTVVGCRELGVKVLTLYTFSVENWHRPATEVSALMRLLQQTLREQREEMRENGITLHTIGRYDDLPNSVRRTIEETQEYLKGGSDMKLILALSYGGRAELVDAMRGVAAKAKSGELDPDRIDETTIKNHLYTAGLPDPDLVIRTSGEERISNFLLWQTAYSEWWVNEVLWPDFSKEHLFTAVRDFQKRERRFGRVR
ncbi:MAG: isoprenyl transferase [Candidatus Eisenbacteria bacterium]|uniref:Isoprenyl transferase n=1 Tax=Eiseniibacteriota bacterium TaxID=2212470 RepID=A0A7Y2H2Y8_UNCEI|nr:isoprenyl transferase [Candidatus Eisenbacteria bacterium]